MNNVLKIGIFGVELTSVNYGCAALGLTQLTFIEKILKQKSIDCEYFIFSNDDIDKVERLKGILEIKSKISIKKLINFRDGIKGINYISKQIEECDLIFDLTYGDSFSDIYGFKNFILYTIPKLLSLHNRKKLIIAPQTIGPYKSVLARYFAKKILKKADYVCIRDEESLEYAKSLIYRDDYVLTSDLAMELPYKKKIFNGNKFKIGINVSDLLWKNTNKENKEKFGIIIDYKDLIKEIINKFSNENYEIHLVTHVYAKDDKKGEYALAKNLHDKYPRTILAPKFDSPIDAKSYMSGLDLFLGSRMHATIGAFSAGVPVIPISYSRKFEGLYGSLGYQYGINLRENTLQESMKLIDKVIKEYEEVEKEREKSFEKALKKNENYHKLLERIIK